MDKWIHSPPLAPPPAPAPRVLLYLAPGALPLRRGRRRGQRHQLPWRRLRELRRAVLHVVIQVPVVGVTVKQAADSPRGCRCLLARARGVAVAVAAQLRGRVPVPTGGLLLAVPPRRGREGPLPAHLTSI